MIGIQYIGDTNTTVPDWFVKYYDSGYFEAILVVLLLVLVVLVVAICRLYYQTKEAQRMIDKFDREREEKRDDDRYEVEFRDVSFRYPNTEAYALRHVSMKFRIGEKLAVVGLNGAGKTTLVKLICGLLDPTEGAVFCNGINVKDFDRQEYYKLFSVVFQDFYLPPLTIAEAISCDTLENTDFDRVAECLALADLTGKIDTLPQGVHSLLVRDVNEDAVELSGGETQRLLLARALYKKAPMVILDEPTAALTDIEVEGLFQIIHKLTEEGKSVIFISHKMREVLQISDRITILRTGEVITTLDRSETDGQELANLMIGRELAPSHYGKVEEPGDPVIQMRSVDYHKESKHAGLSGVSLTVGRGEIVGIAGVDGNGQSQLAQVVTGVLTPDGGEVDMKGSKVAQFTPNGFILENVSHIPEDRNKMGLIGNMSVKDNIVLKATDSPEFSSAKGYFLKKKAIRDYALKMQEKYDIRCTSVEQETRNLSGGNQQKVILARELEGSPDLLVAVHPTRGLDIGATRFVHDTMIEARDKGCGVLLISADFDEILEVSDRIVVMFEGQIMGVFSGKNPPIEEISLAMAGK